MLNYIALSAFGFAFVVFLFVVLAVGLVALFRAMKPKAAPAPPLSAYAAPLRSASTPADLLDLHIDYQDRREREIRRQAQQRRLDQAALEHEALVKIGQILTPPSAAAPPPAAPPNA